MTDKILVGEEAMLDFIDQIRSLLPEELRRARLMVKDQQQMMDDARRGAERIMAETDKRVEDMIKESEMVRQAQSAAEEIIAQGRRVANEIKSNATLYADDIMSSLEENLEQSLTVVRRGRDELGRMKKSQR
jgi:vacuolar-type H+-ATPase subunit H